jgi:hypothetical protein
MYSEQPEVTENKFWSWNAAYENYELYNVCNNHRKNVTIDESQKPGHFCKIKKSPPGHNSEGWKRVHVQENPDVWYPILNGPFRT